MPSGRSSVDRAFRLREALSALVIIVLVPACGTLSIEGEKERGTQVLANVLHLVNTH